MQEFLLGPFIDDLITLCEADITTKNQKRYDLYHNNFKIVREKIVNEPSRLTFVPLLYCEPSAFEYKRVFLVPLQTSQREHEHGQV